jgi:hypothetical protein
MWCPPPSLPHPQTPADWAFRMFRHNPSYVVGELFMPGAEVLHRHGAQPALIQQYLAPVILACTKLFNRPKLRLLMTMEVAFIMLQQVGCARQLLPAPALILQPFVSPAAGTRLAWLVTLAWLQDCSAGAAASQAPASAALPDGRLTPPAHLLCAAPAMY